MSFLLHFIFFRLHLIFSFMLPLSHSLISHHHLLHTQAGFVGLSERAKDSFMEPTITTTIIKPAMPKKSRRCTWLIYIPSSCSMQEGNGASEKTSWREDGYNKAHPQAKMNDENGIFLLRWWVKGSSSFTVCLLSISSAKTFRFHTIFEKLNSCFERLVAANHCQRQRTL